MVYACSPTNILSFAACCSATLSLIKLADYGSKDPPSAWTTGSDHTNGSGATPSAWSRGSSSLPSLCLSVRENVYQGNTIVQQGRLFLYTVAWEGSWKTHTVESRNVPRKTEELCFLECRLFHPLKCVQIYCKAPLGLYLLYIKIVLVTSFYII